MPTIQDVVAEIRTHAKSCPDFTLERAVRRALREFCRESWYYQRTLKLDAVANQTAYHLELNTDQEVVGILSCMYKELPLFSARPEDYRVGMYGEPGLFQFEPPSYLLVSPVPTQNEVEAFKVRLVLQPKESSDDVPEEIYRQFKLVLEAGALSFIYSMPEELWSNAPMAAEMERQFRIGCFNAKRLRHRGHTSGSMQIRPRGFL